jgi:hypothetical protein
VFHCEQDLLVNLIVLSPKHARRKFRKHIFEAWDWSCAYCAQELTESSATIDHILSKHRGGHNVRSNMCCCCSSCNKAKGSISLDDWYNIDNPKFTKERFDKIKEWMELKPCSIKLPVPEKSTVYQENEQKTSRIAA